MILKIDGELKPYYAQTLCMMFFPGVKFPEGEQSGPDVPEVHFFVRDYEDKSEAQVRLFLNGKIEEASDSYGLETNVDRSKARQLAAGSAFYQAASRMTGVCPPWGLLTGVRPAKIASELLRAGMDIPCAADWIRMHYHTTPAKARLAAEVSAAESRLITPDMVRKCSVYVAIPFCPSRCAYCSFVSYTSPKLLSLIPEYLTALKSNIHTVFEVIRSLQIPVSSVYIGGGTPTVLNEAQLQFLLETIASETDVSALEEFTLDAGRPDTITAGKLRRAKEYGVSRISVNTQTLNNDILAAIGRSHDADQFFRAYDIASSSGIRHINVDLIAGLPGESAESFSHTVNQIAALRPDNVTVHTFCVKKAAEIRQENSSVYDREGQEAAVSVDYSQKILMQDGYIPYYMYRQKNTVGNLENVGYALPGTEGLYNIYMMEEVHSIFAAGASAVTKLVSPADETGGVRIDRIFEAKYPYEYLKDYTGDAGQERSHDYAETAREFYRTYF